MANSTAPSSSLMLTYAASTAHTKDLTPSIITFKSNMPIFSIRPLALNTSGHRNLLLYWANPCPQRDPNQFVAAAMGDTATAPPPKPKKRISASLLKIDRVRCKRFLEIQKLRETEKEYDVKTAISLLKEMSSSKLVETAEAHFRLNIDPKKHMDQQLRATVSFPKAIGLTFKVAVVTKGGNFDEAITAGAEIVGGEDLIERIRGGFREFDKLIASPDMMVKVVSLGRLLGSRGLLPSPKAGTVTPNIPQAIEEFKNGKKVEYTADKTGIVHIPFGKVEFSEDDLILNFLAAVKSIGSNKPVGAKGVYWRSAHICTSMGPSIRLDVREMLSYKPPSNI
ncbi:hypothetical protein V6N13_070948 [Hibiscus sabdariffa]|uniref:Large ribosomal subunit protein uL1c n=1 Tax=Hibiscus sabdariffa TaxID=183260 RepID=A0ABR2TF73_9ROSI